MRVPPLNLDTRDVTRQVSGSGGGNPMLGLMRVSGGVRTSKILASSDFLNFRADRRLVPRSRRGAQLRHAAASRRERETPTLSRACRDRGGTHGIGGSLERVTSVHAGGLAAILGDDAGAYEMRKIPFPSGSVLVACSGAEGSDMASAPSFAEQIKLEVFGPLLASATRDQLRRMLVEHAASSGFDERNVAAVILGRVPAT